MSDQEKKTLHPDADQQTNTDTQEKTPGKKASVPKASDQPAKKSKAGQAETRKKAPKTPEAETASGNQDGEKPAVKTPSNKQPADKPATSKTDSAGKTSAKEKAPKKVAEVKAEKNQEAEPPQQADAEPKTEKRPFRVAPWAVKRMEKQKAQAAKKEAEQKAQKSGAKKQRQESSKPHSQPKQARSQQPKRKDAGKQYGTQGKDRAVPGRANDAAEKNGKAKKMGTRPNEAPQKPYRKSKDPSRDKYLDYSPDIPSMSRNDGRNTLFDIYEDAATPPRRYWNIEDEKERANAGALLDLEYAVTSQEIRSGIISGVVPIGVFKDVCAAISSGNYQVFIPFSDMFCDGPLSADENTTEEMLRTRQKQLLMSSIGARVHYVVLRTFTNSDGQTFGIGSRRQAMLRDQKRFYEKDDTHEHPFIVEGGIYKADIIGVGNHGIRVCLFGVDSQMWVSAISYRWIDNAKKHFKPGDKIWVKVRKIKARENGVGLDVELSGKDVENRERKLNASRLTLGGIYTAHVTNIKTSAIGRSAVAHLFIDGYNVPASANMISMNGGLRSLRPGALVAFRVHNIDQETGNVKGLITQIIQNSSASPSFYD